MVIMRFSVQLFPWQCRSPWEDPDGLRRVPLLVSLCEGDRDRERERERECVREGRPAYYLSDVRFKQRTLWQRLQKFNYYSVQLAFRVHSKSQQTATFDIFVAVFRTICETKLLTAAVGWFVKLNFTFLVWNL